MNTTKGVTEPTPKGSPIFGSGRFTAFGGVQLVLLSDETSATSRSDPRPASTRDVDEQASLKQATAR